MVERHNMVSTAADYVGVLAEMDGLRLVISPYAAFYEVQEPATGGDWRTLRQFDELRFLWDWCFVNDVEPTPEFDAATEGLPNDPHKCPASPYLARKAPWWAVDGPPPSQDD